MQIAPVQAEGPGSRRLSSYTMNPVAQLKANTWAVRIARNSNRERGCGCGEGMF